MKRSGQRSGEEKEHGVDAEEWEEEEERGIQDGRGRGKVEDGEDKRVEDKGTGTRIRKEAEGKGEREDWGYRRWKRRKRGG